jgi:hypothetical protein
MSPYREREDAPNTPELGALLHIELGGLVLEIGLTPKTVNVVAV